MARNAKTIDYHKDYYRGLSKFYFNKIIHTIIKFGNLNKEKGVILDYGCGVGHLKKILKNKNVIGYDIIPELSDIRNYKKIKTKKIVLSGVLEHMHPDEIDNLLRTFILLNPKAELLVYLPTENFVSKIAMRLSGQKNAHDDHVSEYKKINNLIEKYYYPKRRKYIFLKMAQITKYLPLNKEMIIKSFSAAKFGNYSQT